MSSKLCPSLAPACAITRALTGLGMSHARCSMSGTSRAVAAFVAIRRMLLGSRWKESNRHESTTQRKAFAIHLQTRTDRRSLAYHNSHLWRVSFGGQPGNCRVSRNHRAIFRDCDIGTGILVSLVGPREVSTLWIAEHSRRTLSLPPEKRKR